MARKITTITMAKDINPELLCLNQDTILEDEAIGMAFPVDSTISPASSF